jgi:alkanesulfonate monooxygenase SsuD/methylene tetrahydromethanopterin reductase-like flavin-dependent oxidoreductase (luciferase family)
MAARQVHVGMQTPQHAVAYARLRRTWLLLDELGFDSAWVMDHFYPVHYPSGHAITAGCFEGWTLLSALAPLTVRVRVGCLVSGNTYRNPFLLARMAQTLDHATDGRLIMGIGAGWNIDDHEGFGFDFPRIAERLRRMEEAIRVFRHVWSGSDAAFTGRFYSGRAGLPSLPAPVQGDIPVMIGGVGEQLTLRIVAEHAQMWNMYAPTYEQFTHKCEVLAGHCATIGRDPATIHKTLHMPICIGATREQAAARARARFPTLPDSRAAGAAGFVINGTPDEVITQLRGYVDIGADGFVFAYEPPHDDDELRLFADEVLPALR